ncbi:NAD(P)/FAD-dependent oxidoreductase [Oryzifoliimicrobium ureilyticus]|uniref:NAD(P)/FAD-dependent oxidoreductase n=1 Tax=Oryzifoliimicrobium ureilyticus TaxID=3113724 RepID=UPI00307653AB
MLDDPHSHGLWERSAPPAPTTTELVDELTVDVVIVGAGYTGLSAALHLAEAGVKTAVLEATAIGFGGAGRNVGLINAGMWVMPDDLPGVLGPVYGERLLDLLGNAPRLVMEIIERHGIDCELTRNGTLHLAVGDKGLKEIEDRARQWQARGAPVVLLDAAETERRVGSRSYTGALLDKRAGTLQPLAYARGLAKSALAAGAAIFTASPVTEAIRKDRHWQVATPKGHVTAQWVIVATDAYSTGPWERVRTEQVHLPYFNLATQPLSDNLRRSILPGLEGAWDTKEVLSSFRLDKAGRLVFGSVGALRNSGKMIHPAWAKRAMHKLFPQLGDTNFDYQWYGKIGMTVDALPRFHRFDQNVIGFSGYNGRGIAPGTVFGRTLAEHILGQRLEGDLPLPVSDVNEPAFRTLKEIWYEAGAQIAHMADSRL